MFGKKIFGKKVRKTRFYIHTNIVTKKCGNKTRETILQKHTISAVKNVGKNSSEKVRKTFFYIYTNIVTKKWGGKTRETIFSEKE